MCNMYLPTIRIAAVLFSYIVAQAKAYPMQTWPMQAPREYPDDEYYYAPKVQYYYDAPAISMSEVYGQLPYPYFYDPYGHFASNEAPKRQEERLAALPIGQETWFESDTTPRWRANDGDADDVSAAFLDNLILTQMAQDAQRRRENARAAFPPVDYDERDNEDEDVRELKALAGKPLYHVPKTVPRIEDEDYASDDGFINWNGNKRSVSTPPPVSTTTTVKPKMGQLEEVLLRPAQTPHQKHGQLDVKDPSFYDTIAKLLENSRNSNVEESPKRRIDKRFVAGDSDLVLELRGLKHRIRT